MQGEIMRKIRSLFLIWLIIMTLLTSTGCAKSTNGADDASQEVAVNTAGLSYTAPEVETTPAAGQNDTMQTIETATPEQPEATQEAETAAPEQPGAVQALKTEFEIGGKTVKLAELSLFSDKLSLLIPDSFDVMSDDMAKLKYPTDHRPTLIYTNEDATVNIAFHHTEDAVTDQEIDEYLTLLKQSFTNAYPSAEFYDSDVIKINSKKVGYVELLSQAVDTDIYNLIWFTVLDGRLLLMSFNCTEELMDDWEPIAKTIMDSQQYSS